MSNLSSSCVNAHQTSLPITFVQFCVALLFWGSCLAMAVPEFQSAQDFQPTPF